VMPWRGDRGAVRIRECRAAGPKRSPRKSRAKIVLRRGARHGGPWEVRGAGGREADAACRDVRRAATNRQAAGCGQATFASSSESAVCSPPCGITGRQNRRPVRRSCFNSAGESSGYRSAMNVTVSAIHVSRSSSHASMTPHWRIALNNSSRARSNALGALRMRFSLLFRVKTLPHQMLRFSRPTVRRPRPGARQDKGRDLS